MPEIVRAVGQYSNSMAVELQPAGVGLQDSSLTASITEDIVGRQRAAQREIVYQCDGGLESGDFLHPRTEAKEICQQTAWMYRHLVRPGLWWVNGVLRVVEQRAH